MSLNNEEIINCSRIRQAYDPYKCHIKSCQKGYRIKHKNKYFENEDDSYCIQDKCLNDDLRI